MLLTDKGGSYVNKKRHLIPGDYERIEVAPLESGILSGKTIKERDCSDIQYGDEEILELGDFYSRNVFKKHTV